MTEYFPNTPSGWQCPVCGTVNAPFVTSCPNAHSVGPRCTCAELTTAACPAHFPRWYGTYT